MDQPTLSIQKLRVWVKTRRRVFRILDQIDLDLEAGEPLALLGESGCGKSILAAALLGLLPEGAHVSGVVRALGYKNLLELPSETLNRLRGRVLILIPQNPQGSLNPLLRVETHLRESIRRNNRSFQGISPRDFLVAVGVPHADTLVSLFPHELSGGMAQRVVTALGLTGTAEVVIADEPTKGLETEAGCYLLDVLRTRFASAAMMVITHDLRVAAALPCAAVMYAGEIVEKAESKRLFCEPLHPYTQGLVRAHPAFGLLPIPGTAPSPGEFPLGCRFAPRCVLANERCHEEHPLLQACGPTRWLRCFHAAS